MIRLLTLFFASIFFFSCEEDLKDISLVYENDFESGLSDEIIGGSIHTFNSSQMTGSYNNEGFTVLISDLPTHDQVIVSMDLYIHDSWDGNQQEIGGPDLWMIEVDDLNSRPNNHRNIFQTTFSNSGCNWSLCLYQSYPEEYPFTRSPKTGVIKADLPGVCYLSDSPSGTSLYQVERAFHHKGESLLVHFYDRLTQTNTSDPKCDESWSLDNLRVWTLNFN